MGRKKITIQPIKDERNRHVTFNKRKAGLIKKAMELSILCSCQIALVIFNADNQLYEYCSTDPRFILQRYCQVAHLPHDRLTNADYTKFDKQNKQKGGKKKGGRGKSTSKKQQNQQGQQQAMQAALAQQQAFQQMAKERQRTTNIPPNVAAQFAQMQNLRQAQPISQQQQQLPVSSQSTQPQSSTQPTQQPQTSQQSNQQQSTPNIRGIPGFDPNLNLALTPKTLDAMNKVMSQAATMKSGTSQSPSQQQPSTQPPMQLPNQQSSNEKQPYEAHVVNAPRKEQIKKESAEISQSPGTPQTQSPGSKGKKRKFQEDQQSPSGKTKKKKSGGLNLTIQVPKNRPNIPLRPVNRSQQQKNLAELTPGSAQLRSDTPESNQSSESKDKSKQKGNKKEKGKKKGDWTPMGVVYSPYPQEKSPTTPLNLATPTSLNNMDWPSPKSAFASST